MKRGIFALFFLMGLMVSAQTIDYNTKRGYVANGYDVVAYFSGEALAGDKALVATHDGVKYKFATAANLNTFKANPEKYVPLYGGYCAYAVATSSDKVAINPETFKIMDGRLLLFYNAWGNNTLSLWDKESPKKLKEQADSNWERIKDQ